MSGRRYCAIVHGPDEAAVRVLNVDLGWREERERYGETAADIAVAVAGDHPTCALVRVVSTDAGTKDCATWRAPSGPDGEGGRADTSAPVGGGGSSGGG